MPARRTQAERSRTTRAALLAAARELFTEHGFAGTGRDQIAERAGVTRGALYHHFASKELLFRSVVEELEREILQEVLDAAMKTDDPMEQLRLGCLAFLDACLEPAVQRIVMVDAPAVLGRDEWRAIEAEHGLTVLTHGLEAAIEAGRIAGTDVEPLAHMLHAALNEAAMMVATAPKPRQARAQVGRTVELLLAALETSKS
jgi:AcrR family transcriptional regulator